MNITQRLAAAGHSSDPIEEKEAREKALLMTSNILSNRFFTPPLASGFRDSDGNPPDLKPEQLTVLKEQSKFMQAMLSGVQFGDKEAGLEWCNSLVEDAADRP